MPAPDYAIEIAALESAAASGELTVESDGDRVTYRDTASIMRAIDYFRARAASSATAPGSTTTVASYSPE